MELRGVSVVKSAMDATQLGTTDNVQQSLRGGLSFVEDNAKVFVALAVIAVIAALGYLGFQFVEKRQEQAAQEVFYGVEAKYNKIHEAFERAKFQSIMPDLAQKDKDAPKAATGNLEQDYGTLIADLEKVAREHSGTAGGAQAAILAAETYLSYNQPDKAIEVIQLPAKNLPSKHLLTGLSKMLWGNALASKGDCQGAIGIWQQVLEAKSVAFLHADAALRAGVCFESLKQMDKAAEMYRRVSTEAADSAVGAQAKAMLRALELKK